jgi:hypothetical protein
MEKTQPTALIDQAHKFTEGLSEEQRIELSAIIAGVYALGEGVGRLLGGNGR